MSEGDGVAIVTVEMLEGTVGDGESFSLLLSTQGNTAKSVYYGTHKDYKNCLK